MKYSLGRVATVSGTKLPARGRSHLVEPAFIGVGRFMGCPAEILKRQAAGWGVVTVQRSRIAVTFRQSTTFQRPEPPCRAYLVRCGQVCGVLAFSRSIGQTVLACLSPIGQAWGLHPLDNRFLPACLLTALGWEPLHVAWEDAPRFDYKAVVACSPRTRTPFPAVYYIPAP
jgi:hypothetical protein